MACEAASTQPLLRPHCESAQGTALGENEPAKLSAQGPVPAHLQKQRRLYKERDVEKLGKAQSQQDHSDPLVTMCLGMNDLMALSLSYKGVSWQHKPPQPSSCPNTPTHPCPADLPPCPAMDPPHEPLRASKGCSWFCAPLRTSSQKGLEKTRAGSVVAVDRRALWC